MWTMDPHWAMRVWYCLLFISTELPLSIGILRQDSIYCAHYAYSDNKKNEETASSFRTGCDQSNVKKT